MDHPSVFFFFIAVDSLFGMQQCQRNPWSSCLIDVPRFTAQGVTGLSACEQVRPEFSWTDSAEFWVFFTFFKCEREDEDCFIQPRPFTIDSQLFYLVFLLASLFHPSVDISTVLPPHSPNHLRPASLTVSYIHRTPSASLMFYWLLLSRKICPASEPPFPPPSRPSQVKSPPTKLQHMKTKNHKSNINRIENWTTCPKCLPTQSKLNRNEASKGFSRLQVPILTFFEAEVKRGCQSFYSSTYSPR